MASIAVVGAIALHTGTTIIGPVPGVVTPVQSFVTIEGKAEHTVGSIMVIPPHLFLPPIFIHAHAFPVVLALQDYVSIEGKAVAVVGANFPVDPTFISTAGQDFVTIS